MKTKHLFVLWAAIVFATIAVPIYVIPAILDAVTEPLLSTAAFPAGSSTIILKGNALRLVSVYAFILISIGLMLWVLWKRIPSKERWFVTVFLCIGLVSLGWSATRNYDVILKDGTITGHLDKPLSGRATASLSQINLAKSGIKRASGLRIVLADGRRIDLPNDRFHRKDQELMLAGVTARERMSSTIATDSPEHVADVLQTPDHRTDKSGPKQMQLVLLWVFGVFPLPLFVCAFILAAKLIHFRADTNRSIAGLYLSVIGAAMVSVGVVVYILAAGVSVGIPFWMLWFLGFFVTCMFLLGLAPSIHFKEQLPFGSKSKKDMVAGLMSMTTADLALINAMQSNEPNEVRVAAMAGASLDAHWPTGETPLHKAAIQGQAAIVKVLLECCANPNFQTDRGHFPLHDALANLSTPVHRRKEIARMLVERGADPNSLDWGRPALHFALDNSDLVKELLSLGADINLPNAYHPLAGPRRGQNFEYRENALRFALKLGAPNDVLQVLISSGSDPLAQNSEGDTAWDYLCEFPNKAINSLSLFEQQNRPEILRACNYSRSLLQPVVEEAQFDILVSMAAGDGWGEFFLGRLEATGKRVWNSRLISKSSSDARSLLKIHVTSAPCAVLFLSSNTDSDEVTYLAEQFSTTPEKLLVVVKSGSDSLLKDYPELEPFQHYNICDKMVESLWNSLCKVAGIGEQWPEDIFLDIVAVSNTKYDFFCSYRSSCAGTVRFLVEQAIARGNKPWFAEYEILISGRRFFQELINLGIASSKRVICCTNSSYAESDYCRIEAMQVLDVPGKESRRILDLRIPNEPNAVSEALQKHGSESVVHDEQTLLKTWASCCRFLGVENTNLPERANCGTPRHIEAAGSAFHMAMDAKWEVRPVGKQIRGGNTVIALFSQRIGSVTLEGELVIGPWAISLPGHTDVNDRDMFESIIKAFKYWNHRQGKIYYPRGVHVIHIPALHSEDTAMVAHPAFTYLDTGREDDKGKDVPIENCTWHRKYSIWVTPPHMPSDMEFCFDFDMKGVKHDDFATFCRYAYLMDDLVRGLRF